MVVFGLYSEIFKLILVIFLFSGNEEILLLLLNADLLDIWLNFAEKRSCQWWWPKIKTPNI